MTWEIAFVFAVVAGALVLFITERYSVDQVALTIPVVLLLAGILTPGEAIAGLSHEATVTVAAMLVLSLGLMKTGAVAEIGRWARSGRLGGPYARLVLLSAIAAGISPFLNNTAVVVIFLPVFLAMAHEANEPPSLYLMPLSFSAILGGTVTLIGTSTNLVVYGMARDRGFDEL
ncbi:MAG: SLC13 family permease, partial [Gemmatimonadota bacterium]